MEKSLTIEINERETSQGDINTSINFSRDGMSDIEVLGALVYGLIMTSENIKNNTTTNTNEEN